jgi:hypothetical protein
VNQTKFDPFTSRLARDIRNTLSKAFLQSVKQHDPVFFHKTVESFLNQQLAPPYRQYIIDRLNRYEKALTVIIENNKSVTVQHAEVLWDLQLYFEMHEILEEIWTQSAGDRRQALQGLIRAAGMKIHAEQGRYKAARSMAEKSLRQLMEYRPSLPEYKKIEKVLEEMRKVAAITDNQSRR